MSENYKPLGMKWHNFLIYFALWTGGIGSFVSAAYIFCGMHYGNVKDRVYAAFPSLQFVDVAYAAALAVLGVYCIYVRYQLAGRKKDAPKKLLTMFVLYAIVPLAYVALLSALTGVSLDAGEIIKDLIGSGVAFIINRTYYNNRKELFVN